MTIVSVWFAIIFCCNVAGESRTNFEVKRFSLCSNTQGRIKYNGNVTKENGNHYLTFEIMLPGDWGDSLGVSCLIESLITAKNSVELFYIKEKSICKAAQIYWGEFWYDIMVATGYPNPRSCPILAGRYRVHHLKLDFNKIALQTIPFGKLRFTITAINNKNPEINMWCIIAEFENFLN